MILSLDDKTFVNYLKCTHIYNDDGYVNKCKLDNTFCVLDTVGITSSCAVCDLYEEKE